MMWTDLHRGHLAQMKKCISTDKEQEYMPHVGIIDSDCFFGQISDLGHILS
jgi:hypothetical protein